MEIKFTFRNDVYSLCIGHKTAWFGQIRFITLTREDYDNMKVVFADSIF